jgi:alkanesulfonate monooxygenase SsuD/methylene tetrahydromethanopterin reductase-like flavin-dependent oxidoreductase (luciferase family)
MKCGIVMPYPNAGDAVEFAAIAEAHGWDGFFVWEPVWGIDAWVSLGGAAVRTKTIQLGTMLSPLSRMRPWKVASEYVTLDQLSGGRAILAVGLGAVDAGFAEFGEETNIKERAELMDEALDIITGLFDGQPFEYLGKHYEVGSTQFFPPPNPIKQTIWVVGLLGSKRSLSRVVKYQGLLPSVRDGNGEWRTLESGDVEQVRTFVESHGCGDDYDIVVEGTTSGEDRAEAQIEVGIWQDAGATWWIESMWPIQDEPNRRELFDERIRQGPPA